ncbi:unnamed protein product [Arabidopsis arenosa]|uniref:Uncharacterized protein n=1 Tax=Arabidopsis arenosa TaxID=38785 RepID=A0A8S1ZRX5_ARAAE|nr:unnamed protein product [Arabidopsis arenosa]
MRAGAQKFVTKAQTLFPKVEPDQEIGAAKKRRKDDVEESSNKRRTKQEDPFAEVYITEKSRRLKELQKRVAKTMNEVRDAEKQRWKRIHDLNKNNMKNLPVKPDHIDTKAQELAILWKGKIRIETPRSSSLEAEDKDWGKLRDIFELMSDYNLKIEMPVDLIVKLMDQRPDNQPSTSNLAC